MALVILAFVALAVMALARYGGLRLGWWMPLAVGVGVTLFGWNESPAIKLLLSSAILLFFVKMSALQSLDDTALPRGLGVLAYLSIWPGMSTRGLEAKGEPVIDSGARFNRGYRRFLAGVIAILLLAWFSPGLPLWWVGIFGVPAILLTVHLGISDILTGCVQCQGYRVEPLFDDPLRSQTLNEFWSRRWNLAFVQMNRILFMRPLTRRFGLRGAVVGSFLISGLLHELAISFPVGAGWGGPFGYFVLQSILVGVERRRRLSGVLWTWVCLLFPLPILFHTAFREGLVAQPFLWVGTFLHSLTYERFWTLAFLGLGLVHFLILAASAQVPSRLNWREELGRLSSLNRKLMWTYGAFIVLCIVTFGVLTLAVRSELVAGNPVGVWLCGFIAVFWGLRVVCDNFVLKFEDWPQGPEFEIGHTLLNTVFITLTTGYGAYVIQRLLLR